MRVENILFVCSERDPAGMSIASELIGYYGMNKVSPNIYIKDKITLIKIKGDIVYADRVDQKLEIKPDVLIFLSRHSSAMKKKTLSVHVSGNPTSKAELGGKPFSLAPSHPIIMKSILSNLNYLALEYDLREYSVTMEVTHHGPTDITTPSLFVEIGSTLSEWKDAKAAKVVAEAITISLEKPLRGLPAVGFGGPHYAPVFTRYVLNHEYAVGHIFSKYVISDEINDKVIKEAFEKTFNAKIALVDWKGIKGSFRKQLINMISKLDKNILRI